MKVLVTGSHGTLGRAFTDYLDERGISYCRYNRNDPKKTENDYDSVVNFAGMTAHSPIRAHDGVDLYHEINVLGTKRILSFIAKNKKLTRFIHIGTSAEYGSRKTRLTEKSPSRPENEYGKSKLAQSRLVREFSRTHAVKVINLRIFNILGVPRHPDQKRQFIDEYILSKLVTGARIAEVSNKSDVRDYIGMKDAFDAILAALKTEKGSRYELINVCSGRGTTVSQLVRLFERETGHVISLVSVNKVKTKYVGSRVKSRRILGWEPSQDIVDIVRTVIAARSRVFS